MSANFSYGSSPEIHVEPEHRRRHFMVAISEIADALAIIGRSENPTFGAFDQGRLPALLENAAKRFRQIYAQKEAPLGSKIHPSDYDCFAKARPDEPYFTLLARDSRAAELVDEWADRYEADEPSDIRKAAEARKIAQNMRIYFERHPETVREDTPVPAAL